MPFYKGDKGDTGDKASISADTPNAIEAGSDGKMLVRLKREIQIPSWPPAFALPNVTYVVRDPETGLVSKWETNDEGQPAAITNPEGVVKVITQIFVNSAGEQLAHL